MARVQVTADERRVRRSDPNLHLKEARDLTSLFSDFVCVVTATL